MRIRISHSIAYAYAEPVRQLRQVLRLTPRDHDGQHVMSWRITPNIDGRLRSSQDPFGNLVLVDVLQIHQSQNQAVLHRQRRQQVVQQFCRRGWIFCVGFSIQKVLFLR